jgi:hypothetical protein
VSNAATASLLLLLALTGGFLFTYRWLPTYYIIQREEGQGLIFVAACAAFPLLLVSSGSLWLADRFLPASLTGTVSDVGAVLVEPYVVKPFEASTFAAFFGALVWGWILPRLLNIYYRPERASNLIIDRYAGELEKLMYRAMGEFLLVSVTLKSRKVYVGWPVRALIPEPRRADIRPHIRLQPAISGYREEATQELVFTTDYHRVYRRIDEADIPGLNADDLQMVIPVEEILSANFFSTDIEQEWFEMPQDEQADTRPPPSSLFHTLLILLIVWRITRRRTRDWPARFSFLSRSHSLRFSSTSTIGTLTSSSRFPRSAHQGYPLQVRRHKG